MNSEPQGKSTSAVEVSHISSHGIWLLTGEKGLFVSYQDFPGFKDASVGQALNVQEPSPAHPYWPDLDIDLTADIIEHSERFPLKVK